MGLLKPIVYSDLDDSIFQTARKMDSASLENATQVTEALNGSHSYMTQQQSLMIDWLLQTTRFIPVTARSTEALSRCSLAFTDYQICSNGAVIIKPGGDLDTHWFEKTRQVAQTAATQLLELKQFVESQATAGKFRCWIVKELGLGLYFCVKSNDHAQRLDEIDSHLSDIAGLQLKRHRNDNNLSFTPVSISKQYAVQYLNQQLQKEVRVPVWGIGDSLTDLPFMASCDMMVVPTNSQIDKQALLACRS